MNSRAPSPLHTAIDIGTNTLLALTGAIDRDGALRIVADRHDITRLGEGVDRTRQLAPEAMDRALATLERFVFEARAFGCESFSAVATSAVRDASNRDAFIARVRAVIGSDVRAIGGDEEALLTFRGACLDLGDEVRRGDDVIAFDIGGGSTEIARGPLGETPRWHRSVDVGSVRLSERLLAHDPPGADELRALDETIARAIEVLPRDATKPAALIGLAATMSTLAAIDRDGVLGPAPITLTASQLERAYGRLASCDLATRRTLPGLDPRRADVIVAGAAIARAVIRWADVECVHISRGGVRVGLLLDRCAR